MRRKIELDVNSVAKSLRKKDVDLAPDRSDAQMPREMRPLKRAVAGHIGIHEDRPRLRIEEPVSPKSYAEPKTITVEPSPESTVAEEPSVGEAPGPGGHAATAAPRPEHSDPEVQALTGEEATSTQDPTDRAGKALYFFYGTLMDPPTLQRVTGLRAAPRMRPAHVAGYTTKLWGPFPVLLRGRVGDVVRGVACEIEGPGPRRRLGEFEGGDYDEWDLEVRLDRPDGTWEVAPGVTFRWVGPGDELEEGAFSLSRWRGV